MELSNEFDVSVPIEQAWGVLTDLERIAPCLPGAQLQEVEGDEYRGIVKIKVGPITAQYKGAAHFVEKNDETHKAVLVASGRDTRGQGNASATITAELTPKGDVTHVSVLTDLTITGKVAQFGRGVIGDVSVKLLDQFVVNLETTVIGAEKAPAEVGASTIPAPAHAADTAQMLASELSKVWDEAKAGTEGAPEPVRAERPSLAPRPDLLAEEQGIATSASTSGNGARRIDAPEAEAIDLLDAAGGSMAKRLVPVLGGLIVLLALITVLRHRRRRS